MNRIGYTFVLLLTHFLNRDRSRKTGGESMKYIKGFKQLFTSNEKENISWTKSELLFRSDLLSNIA